MEKPETINSTEDLLRQKRECLYLALVEANAAGQVSRVKSLRKAVLRYAKNQAIVEREMRLLGLAALL